MENKLSVVQRLDRIRGLLTHPAIDYNDIERRVKYVFRDIEYTKIPFIVKIERVIRATKHSDENWFDGLNKFDYPPTSVISFGRCNRKGEQVFYCSNDNAIPVFEVRPQIGDYVSLSTWAHKEKGKRIEFHCVALGVQHLLDNLEDDELFRRTLLQDDIFKPNVRSEFKELDSYIGDLFIQDAADFPNLYWFTQAVTKAYLNMVGKETLVKLDGIIYPSVAGQLKGYNIVLTKDFRIENLILASVFFYQVKNITENSDYKLQHIKSLRRAEGSVLTWELEADDSFLEFNPHVPASHITESDEYL